MSTPTREVRVRFAPSPTGPLHIGGVRTALYNYLFARRNGGKMILRIEDTDSQRFVPGAEDYINEALAWLGIEIDEGVREGGPYGPYKQSERRDIYREHVKMLLDNGKAYIAFDTPAELEAARAAHPNFQYDASTRGSMRNSLSLPPEEVKRLLDEGAQYVVRFRIEPGRDVAVDDLIRGRVTIKSDILDDKVLYKSADDLPTYHLANIVDDHLMKVSHVIRGEEWLPSAPLHVLLYEAFGWADTMPAFVHLPLLLKPDGKGKLSKRDGDRLGFPVFPLLWTDPKSGDTSAGYRENGYLPEAVVNFLALLGWNPGDDTEIMDMVTLISKFSLEHCSKAGAKFAFDKAKWFNHTYLQALPDDKLADMFVPVLKAHGVDAGAFAPDYIAKAVSLVKSRINFVNDLWDNARFFFVAPESYDPKAVKKRWNAQMSDIMRELAALLQSAPDFGSAALEPAVMQWIADKGYHLGNVMNAFRLTVVGECKGPHMFDITDLLGRDETIRRILRGADTIKPVDEPAV
ncbi:MAG: glutamate--tRNA ligase [Muribaculaceae bacterium]|nr:glutamate--tRNA ligase [Muribaculaceae bacterium]